MAHNHLEQLIAEWYEYQGYFVRRNVHVGLRPMGGYECELDVIAFHPATRHLVHLEPSLDADSWKIREKRFRLKFEAGKRHIPELFKGLDIPQTIEQIAVLVFASKVNVQTLGGGKILMAGELIQEIFQSIQSRKLAEQAIPEQFTILRSFQYVNEYRDIVMSVWEGSHISNSKNSHGK
jgi:hypothetical protein